MQVSADSICFFFFALLFCHVCLCYIGVGAEKLHTELEMQKSAHFEQTILNLHR